MAPSTTCGVCGTVNVVATGRCIACSQPLADFDPTEALPPPGGSAGGPAAPAATSKTAPLEEGDYKAAAAQAAVHLGSQGAAAAPAAGPATPAAAPAAAVWPPPDVRSPSTAEWADQPAAPAEPPAPPPAPAPPPPQAEPRTDDLSGSALRRTVIEPAARRLRPKSEERAPEQRDSRDEIAPGGAGAGAGSAEPSAPRGPGEARFVLRLLLPEGDKRLVEMHDKPMRVGSGLDEVGLAGDPRIRASEATLVVADGGLWIDVAPESAGVYRRVDGEEALSDGDVVLVGDIAARFQSLPAASPVADDSHVLGGAAGSACGRLVFLRRDGSPGPVHDLPQGKTILGRTDGHINFPSDSRLSRRHARFYASDARVTVEDLDSRNGTYVRVRGRRRLSVGDALRVGSAGLQIRAPG